MTVAVGDIHGTTGRWWVKYATVLSGKVRGAALKVQQIGILFLLHAHKTIVILPHRAIFHQLRSVTSLAAPQTSRPLSFHYIFWPIQTRFSLNYFGFEGFPCIYELIIQHTFSIGFIPTSFSNIRPSLFKIEKKSPIYYHKSFCELWAHNFFYPIQD